VAKGQLTAVELADGPAQQVAHGAQFLLGFQQGGIIDARA
jgi:hypothetical protein